MASKFTIGQRVQVTAPGEIANGQVGTVDWIARGRSQYACGVVLDRDPHEMSAYFDDDELVPAP